MTSKEYTRRRAKRPKKMSRQAIAVCALVVGVLILFSGLVSWGKWNKGRVAAPMIAPMDMGCLEKVEIPDEQPEIMAHYTGFTVSFNPSRHIPNYVVWELTGAEAAGELARKSKFFTDKDVLGCPSPDDYKNSGFDRGHMAPAGDMKWSEEAMADSHVMTNICPQDHSVNGGRWSTLEKKCRQWAARDSALVIVCGPVMTDEMPQTIGRSKVSVPRRFFKIVAAPYADPPRAIAFVVPNFYTADGLESMACSVDDVEALTGYDFFACLPDEIENRMESEANFRYWNRRKR